MGNSPSEPARGTFDGLDRQQLLVYARELAAHFRKEQSLQQALSERERKLRELTAAFMAAQEEERQWISLEVHDRIAQLQVSIFQHLEILASMTQTDAKARPVILRASALVREAIREARNIMNDLHPPILDEFGVVPLINEELRRFQEDTGCQARFNHNYQVRPRRDVEVALYRIFHEALTNIRRHASTATGVAVTLTCQDHGISLQVEDNGPGFEVKATTQHKRIGGLLSMQRRAEILGGSLELASTPGQGTKVTVSLPHDPDNQEEK